MQDGWIKLYRKSVGSQVFADERLWKLWCLCLLKANHKAEYVPIEGIVQPVKIEPGQFITGRYELHGDYHQRRRGYKKRSPSPVTVWRWLLSLRDMQNLNIKSFSKYSIISISNWNLYQINEQQMINRRSTDDHKQEVLRMNKNMSVPQKTDPDVKIFILGWIEIWSQKFGEPYTPNWGKEGRLVKEMLKFHSLQELGDLRREFFRSDDSFVRSSDYSIGIIRSQLNKLIAARKQDPIEQARAEMRGNGFLVGNDEG